MVPTASESCATAREIAAEAAKLFAKHGYDATPVRSIAEAAGVTCPTLYYHFGSKEGLAQALLLKPLQGISATLERLLARSDDPLDLLVEAAEAYFAFSRSDPDRSRFLYAVMFGPLGQGLAAEIDARFRANAGLLLEIGHRLAAAGVVAPGSVGDLILGLRGQVVIRTMDFLYREGTLGPDLARQVVGQVLLGHVRAEHRERVRTAMSPAASVDVEDQGERGSLSFCRRSRS